ncbi:M28 family peptidase [Wukongibacter baidiensis]|uniref:M28 family peptidase n=1 Tax=Wukongibacter baidiensis TaxID=1723361 RepID=UPI003D7F97A8
MECKLKPEQIERDLTELCINIGDRHVGSLGNQKATDYVSKRLESNGFKVEMPEFKCIDWEYGEVTLKVGNESVEAFPSPYSLFCDIEKSFETACTLEELSNKDFTDKIAVLYGELCKEQLMPKNFVFYNPESHKKIVSTIEEKAPIAVVAITSRNPELAGAWYPFPLFEDGDFDIPSVFLTEEEGRKILSSVEDKMYLKIESKRIPSKGYNVIGTKEGSSNQRIVFCAHIDTKKGTPGALDNGTGVTSLLALADLLKDYKGRYCIEILVVNGEDYYAASGQMLYLSDNKDRFNDILLAVNSDGAGHRGYKTTFSCFDCKEGMQQSVHKAFEDNEKFIEIDPWYQSDHMIFVMNGISAVAITSENVIEVMTEIAHTADDKIDKVDSNKILEIAQAMKDIIKGLDDSI